MSLITSKYMWQQWVNLLLGLWIIVSYYVVSPDGMGVNLIVSAGAIAILALWGALEHRSMMEQHTHSHA